MKKLLVLVMLLFFGNSVVIRANGAMSNLLQLALCLQLDAMEKGGMIDEMQKGKDELISMKELIEQALLQNPNDPELKKLKNQVDMEIARFESAIARAKSGKTAVELFKFDPTFYNELPDGTNNTNNEQAVVRAYVASHPFAKANGYTIDSFLGDVIIDNVNGASYDNVEDLKIDINNNRSTANKSDVESYISNLDALWKTGAFSLDIVKSTFDLIKRIGNAENLVIKSLVYQEVSIKTDIKSGILLENASKEFYMNYLKNSPELAYNSDLNISLNEYISDYTSLNRDNAFLDKVISRYLILYFNENIAITQLNFGLWKLALMQDGFNDVNNLLLDLNIVTCSSNIMTFDFEKGTQVVFSLVYDNMVEHSGTGLETFNFDPFIENGTYNNSLIALNNTQVRSFNFIKLDLVVDYAKIKINANSMKSLKASTCREIIR